MAGSSIVLVLVSVIFVTGVRSWTVDLPEVRRFYFEKYSKLDEPTPIDKNDNVTYFDNINGDSPHNTDGNDKHNYDVNIHNDYDKKRNEKKNNVYANSYNHEMYMVRKVSHGVLASGPKYLEGLRLAIEQYTEVLKNCSRRNFTVSIATPPLSIGNFSGVQQSRESCRRATQHSEAARRLAGLALLATARLQDVADAAKYNKDASMEENELLLRLAWYLDKLAHLTGYDPQVEPYIPQERTTRASVPLPPFNPLNVTEEQMRRLLECLKQPSDEPATARCALAAPAAPAVADQIRAFAGARFPINVGAPPAPQQGSPRPDTPRERRRSSDDISAQLPEQEVLLATDNTYSAPIRSVKKRSVSDESSPLVKYLKYYAKYQSWENSNPKSGRGSADDDPKSFDVENHLPSKIAKRSIPDSKYRIPDNPMPDLSKYIKNKPGVHYIKNKITADALKSAFDKIYGKKLLPPMKLKKLRKIFRVKRSSVYPEIPVSAHYEGVINPRIPVDPQGDISYYVKNKEGTEVSPDVVQAALVRAALEAVFQRGNLLVVQRYGSNYNPAVGAPLYAGIARSMADI